MSMRSCGVGFWFSAGNLKGFTGEIAVVELVVSPASAAETDGGAWRSSGGPRRCKVVDIVDSGILLTDGPWE